MPDPAQTAQAVQQATEAAGTAIDGGLAAAGGAGTIFMGWLAWILKRAFGITIPRLASAFQEALEKQGETFKAALAEQRADYREEMKLTRSDFKESLKEMQADFNSRLDKLATAVERLDQTMRTQGK